MKSIKKMGSKIEKTPMKQCCVLLEPLLSTPNNFTNELKRVINERNLLTVNTRQTITQELDRVVIENKERNRLEKRKNLINEILESEKHYIEQLDKVKKFFLKPTEEQKLLNLNDFNTLFGNLNIIYNLNIELLKELQENPQNIGGAFRKFAPFFKLYSVYARQFKKSLIILQNCQRNNPKFAKFLEMQETRPEVQSKLSALLIAPIQRVPRYKLLLNSLFNLTLIDDRDYEDVLESFERIEEAAKHINRIVKDEENMQHLIELQRCFLNNKPCLIIPNRKLIYEGVLIELLDNCTKQKLYTILMNDIIVFCKIMKKDFISTKKPNSLKCLQIFPLNKCQIYEILDKGSFRIKCESNEIVLYNKHFNETKQWIEEIKTTINTLLSNKIALRSEFLNRHPVKRNNINDYSDLGVTPRKRLKKRQSINGEDERITPPIVEDSKRPALKTFNKNDTNDLNEYRKNTGDGNLVFKVGKWVYGWGTTIKNLFSFKKS